jgi:hypothetical protein
MLRFRLATIASAAGPPAAARREIVLPRTLARKGSELATAASRDALQRLLPGILQRGRCWLRSADDEEAGGLQHRGNRWNVRCPLTKESAMTEQFQEFHMVSIPIWIAIPVLLIVLLAGWKLAKLLWAAISN